MSGSNRVNTRARRLSQKKEDEEEYDHTSSCSSAEGARRSAAEDARNSRLEQRPNAIQLAQEDTLLYFSRRVRILIRNAGDPSICIRSRISISGSSPLDVKSLKTSCSVSNVSLHSD
jgi:hypothetical protein